MGELGAGGVGGSEETLGKGVSVAEAMEEGEGEEGEGEKEEKEEAKVNRKVSPSPLPSRKSASLRSDAGYYPGWIDRRSRDLQREFAGDQPLARSGQG